MGMSRGAGNCGADSGQFAPSLRGGRALRYNFLLMERATLLLEIGCEELPAAFMRGALEGLRDGMVRLVGWDWIREALEGLPCD